MSFTEKLKEIPKWGWVFVGIWTVVSAVGGGLFSDVREFRGKRFETASTTVDAAFEANEALTPLLIKFAKLALNEGTVSSDDRVELDQIINKANDKAFAVKTLYPKLNEQYVSYSDALIELKQSADKLRGPLTGKDFVKAVSDYSVASERFRVATQDAKGSYLGTLLP